MDTNNVTQIQVINLVLIVTLSISPVIFGFILWKLSSIFATKSDLARLERTVEEQTKVIIQLQIRAGKLDTPHSNR